MNYSDQIIAKRYAVAYINLYIDQIKEKNYQALVTMLSVLPHYRQALFFIQIPVLSQSVKRKGLAQLSDRFAVGASFDRLLNLLFDDQRIALLPAVVWYTIEEYQRRTGITVATIASSSELSLEQKDEIERFFDRLMDKKVTYTHVVDKQLIAGIRFQSDTSLWEYSVDKQLRECEQELAKGGSWK